MHVQVNNEREKLVLEQALLAYREVEAARLGAAYGHGMEVLEQAVIDTGRRQQRQVLELALRSQAEAQKKGADARPAARR